MSEFERFAAEVVALIKGVADSCVSEFAARDATIAELRAQIAAIPAGKDGAPGRDGKSIDAAHVQEWVATQARAAVAAFPAPRDGKDGRDGISVSLEAVQALVGAEVTRAAAALPRPTDGKDGAPGKDGETGRDGKDGAPGKDGETGRAGKDGADAVIDVDEVVAALKRDSEAVAMLRGERGEHGPRGDRGEAGASGQDGRNGADGAAGRDGASVTPEQLREVVEQRFASWALDFERLATDRQRAAIDSIPLPRDGRDGKDGRAGLGLDDFEFEADLIDERTLVITIKTPDLAVSREIKLPVPIDRGTYPSAGGQFERGDCVTHGGQLYIAQRDTRAKPGESPDWRLAVRRGRDGKDAAE